MKTQKEKRARRFLKAYNKMKANCISGVDRYGYKRRHKAVEFFILIHSDSLDGT